MGLRPNQDSKEGLQKCPVLDDRPSCKGSVQCLPCPYPELLDEMNICNNHSPTYYFEPKFDSPTAREEQTSLADNEQQFNTTQRSTKDILLSCQKRLYGPDEASFPPNSNLPFLFVSPCANTATRQSGKFGALDLPGRTLILTPLGDAPDHQDFDRNDSQA